MALAREGGGTSSVFYMVFDSIHFPSHLLPFSPGIKRFLHFLQFKGFNKTLSTIPGSATVVCVQQSCHSFDLVLVEI